MVKQVESAIGDSRMNSSNLRYALTISAVAVWLGIVTFFHVCPSQAADRAGNDIIRHSDIDMLSWYPPGQHTVNPEDFRKWNATLVTWGLDTIFTRTENVPQSLSVLVKAAYDGGVRSYLANLDMCSAQPWNHSSKISGFWSQLTARHRFS